VNFLEPEPTPLDLRWRMFGIECRVHPSFWLVAMLFGLASGGHNSLRILVAWMLCMFVSVLVHELGHVLMGRTYGEPGHILLYSMGGYAMGMYDRLERWQRIMVSFAGPGMGFLFLITIIHIDPLQWNALMTSMFIENQYGRKLMEFLHIDAPLVHWSLLERFDPLYGVRPWYNAFGGIVSLFLVVMNLYWNLLNLIPVYPLDGGNIMRDVSTGVSPRTGLRFALGFGFLVAGLIAVYSVINLRRRDLPYFGDPMFNMVMFGLLAMQNFSLLRSVEQTQRRSEYDD
jgi:stage IV sporulation protein FB